MGSLKSHPIFGEKVTLLKHDVLVMAGHHYQM